MKKFLVITGWEFLRYLKSRSFLLATFVSPLVFATIVLIPSLIYESSDISQPQIFGCVEFDSTAYCDLLAKRLEYRPGESWTFPEIILIKINADTSSRLANYFRQLDLLMHERDSLNEAYNKIKERRKYIFQRPRSRTRDRLLRQTYDQLHETREQRDLADIEYNRMKALTDSLLRMEVIRRADSLLMAQVIQGYILIEPKAFREGKVEFHSLLPANFLRINPLRAALQVVLVEKRMEQDGITVSKINEWLKPVDLWEFQLEGTHKREFNFMVSYLGPIIVVLFLFISIFTSSGFLFNGIISEKSNRVIELLVSSVNSVQLMAGKILGLGFLGLFQIFIWIGLTALLVFSGVLDVEEIGFLTLRNAALFILYFTLGYFFFASIFVGIGSLFSSEEDAHHLNQFMRILSIFPIAIAVLVLQSPNSLLVRVLSFIPFLTPTFMILRTPLGQPPQLDYLISTGIMLISIVASILFAGKIFRIGTLLYGKKPTVKEIWALLWIK